MAIVIAATVRRCWCGRPIRDPDGMECAEHDHPAPFCTLCGEHRVLIAGEVCPCCDDDQDAAGGTPRTLSGSTARRNFAPTATVYSTWHRQPPSANVQPVASAGYQRPLSCSTSTGLGSSYLRHQDGVGRSGTAQSVGAA